MLQIEARKLQSSNQGMNKMVNLLINGIHFWDIDNFPSRLVYLILSFYEFIVSN